ncbi:MAG: hypothetical protein RLZ55_1521, partial [Actinomycetota bacterium]
MTKRQIIGRWQDSSGNPASGWIELIPSTRIAAGDAIRPGIPLIAALDPDGEVRVELLTTDSTPVRPEPWVWVVREHIDGLLPRSWAFELPADPTPLELSTADPLCATHDDVCHTRGPAGPPGRDGTSAPADPAVADLLIVATDGDRPAVPRPGQRVFNLSRGAIDVFVQALGAWEVVGQPIRRPDIASLPSTMLPGAVATVGGDLMVLTEDTAAPGTLHWVKPAGPDLGPVTHLATAPIGMQDLREAPDRLAVRAAIRAAMPLAGWYAWHDAVSGLTLALVSLPPRPSTGGDTMSLILFSNAAVACWNFQAGANGLRELGSIMGPGTTTWYNSQFVKPPA